MARLNITFANLTSDGAANPASVAEGLKYTAGTITVASLATGGNSSNVFKIVHTEPVTDASIEDLVAWIEANVPDYSNQLYEVYIPSIKTSDTTLSPTGLATTTYSFTGTKQSDHSMIARATVTSNGTDTYPVGTVLECIIKPDYTRTLWTVTTSVQGILEVSAPVSVEGKSGLLAHATTRAGGRKTFTMIFNSVTFTNANYSPTHSASDVFWVEVIKTSDRVFIRTSAALNAGGSYFNRVYYTRMDIETGSWSEWTPYNFQIMAIDQFFTSGVPDVYVQALHNGYMMFTMGGMLCRLVMYDDIDNKAWLITDYNIRFKLAKSSTTNMWDVSVVSLHNLINFDSTGGTLSEDDLAYINVANTYNLDVDLAVLHHYKTTATINGTTYSLMGTNYDCSTKYLVDVNVNTGAYTVTTQSVGGSGSDLAFYELTESAFNTAANKVSDNTNYVTLSSSDLQKIANGIMYKPNTANHGNIIVPNVYTFGTASAPAGTVLYPRNCTTTIVYYNGDAVDTQEKLFILDKNNSKLWCYTSLFSYTSLDATQQPTAKGIIYSMLVSKPDKLYIPADYSNHVPWRFEYRRVDSANSATTCFYYSARKADSSMMYLVIKVNTSNNGSVTLQKLTSLPS